MCNTIGELPNHAQKMALEPAGFSALWRISRSRWGNTSQVDEDA